MTAVLRSELRKLTTVRTTWVLTLVAWAIVGLAAGGTLFNRFGAPFSGADGQIADALRGVGMLNLFVLIVGLLAMSTEFRHQTAGRTFMAVPARSRVIVAKLTASGAYGVVYALGGFVIVAVALLIAASANNVALSFGALSGRVVWESFAALVLTAFLGAAIGAVMRSQVLAITLTLAWLFVIENLVRGLYPVVGRWLPFQALQSVFLPSDQRGEAWNGVVSLEPGVALLAFLGYVLALVSLATYLLRQRDA